MVDYVVPADLIDKPDKLKMLSADTATLASESKKIVEQLLKEHRVQSIDANLIRQGDEIISAYEGKLAG